MSEQSVKELLETLRAPDVNARLAAVRELARLKEACAVDALLSALKDTDYDVRATAAQALGEIGNPKAIEALVAALRDRVEGVRQRSAEALIHFKGQAFPYLSDVLRDGRVEVRRQAVFILSKSKEAGALEILLGDEVTSVRLQVIEALRVLRAVGPLGSALKDREALSTRPWFSSAFLLRAEPRTQRSGVSGARQGRLLRCAACAAQTS
jgi:HEAT repeat protein